MSSFLARIARVLAHRWKRSLAFALAALVVLGVLAGTANQPADSFDVPGADSQKAYDLFQEHTPVFAGGDATIVYTVDDGKITDAGPKAAVQAALTKLKALDDIASVADPYAAGGTISPDGKLASVDVRYTIEGPDIKAKEGKALEKAAAVPEDSGVEMSQRGLVVDTAAQQEAPIGELVGIAIAIVLLTLLFRSKAAMAATLVGALIGVAVGQLLLTALAEPLGLPSFATLIAVMLGLGAGIDYSLLIIGRFREQLAAGDSVRDAAAKSAATAGTAVVAAGLIVMVAIAGLLVVGIPAIGKMGVGAAIGVLAVVLSALLILPIMMGAFAKRLRPKERAHVDPSPGFARWGERITARPWLAIAVGTLALLVLAFPALDLRLGQPDDGNKPTDQTQRIAYDALTEAFGPGSNGPLLLAVDTSDRGPQTDAEVRRIADAVGEQDGIVSVQPPITSEDGEMATIFAIPSTSPQDKRTSALIERLRQDVLPAATKGTDLEVYVGGNTASFEDVSSRVSSRLPLFIGVVVGLSVLLLVMAFRSLLIPLVSAVLNLLSIVAAYGAVTAVFQDGLGAGLLGVDSGIPIISFIPVLMFAILFGLSMDYNVFLLSRIHEAYNEGDSPRDSVVHGMARIGKVVLFAGLIMAAVFLAFVTSDDVISKMFGVGLGLAILIDVLIVRLVITPAVVLLLGDKAWWLPGWMDRILPNVSLEGHAVESVDAPAAAPDRELVGAQ